MLIDWLTLKVPFDALEPATVLAIEAMSDRIRRYCPRTGEVVWETAAWESVRSDSHQLAVQAGADCLRVQGSPARCMGDGCSVFGSDQSMNIRACAVAMLDLAWRVCGLGPFAVPLSVVKCSRIDVTGNLLLDSAAQVRQALAMLRECEGGRYRVSQVAGDTVYWSHRSRIASDKAYAKGAHLAYMLKRPDYTGRRYTVAELAAADRLLRLERSLKSQFLRERAGVAWYDMDAVYLIEQWRNRFERMIGDVVLVEDGDVKGRIVAAGRTPGQGRAAFMTWCMIEAHGWQFARDNLPRTTWYRHLQVLRAAGFGDADISRGEVVPIRREALRLTPVDSWQELLAA